MNAQNSERRTLLDVVTGKGGVGKSTVAVALALRARRQGQRVLLIEMEEPAGAAGLLGVRPSEPGVPTQVEPGLFLAYYNGEAALAEYLERHAPFGGALRKLFSHPLYLAFVHAGPGVRELMAIGKVRDEMLGLATGEAAWDRIVLDAGSSGDALQLLGMPRAAARTFRSGIAHREATRVAGQLSDPVATRVHLVALAEEMPLEEVAETLERLRELELPIGKLFINRCQPVAPPGAEEAARMLEAWDLASEHAKAAKALALVARRALGWQRVQEEAIAAVRERTGLGIVRLPALHERPFGCVQARALADELAGALR